MDHASHPSSIPPNRSSPPTYSFVQDPETGCWQCPYCIKLSNHQRAPSSFYNSCDPPSDEYVEQHMAYCPMLQSATSYRRANNGEQETAQFRGGEGYRSPRHFASSPSPQAPYQAPPPYYRHPYNESHPPSNSSGWSSVASTGMPHHDPNASTSDYGYHHRHSYASPQGGALEVTQPIHHHNHSSHHRQGTTAPSSAFGYHHSHHMHQLQPYPHHPPPQPQETIVGGMIGSTSTPSPPNQPHPHPHPYPPYPSQAAVAPAPPPPPIDRSRAAADFLASESLRLGYYDPSSPPPTSVVLPEDRALLSDFFFFLTQQLSFCKFTEKDRKSRGGKRDNVPLGYGGIECRHCANESGCRKFFWSNVDRVANSFAGIADHVLKCWKCPEDVKSALEELKFKHREQMARLPKGSQKVFFRRMWRRLHPADLTTEEGGGTPSSVGSPTTPSTATASSPEDHACGESSNSSSVNRAGSSSERCSPPSGEGLSVAFSSGTRSHPSEASLLAGTSGKASIVSIGTPPSPKALLAIDEDRQWLSDLDCLVRRSLEVFCASEEDVAANRAEKRYPIHIGQVGVRCVYCAAAVGRDAPLSATAVTYPFSINGIYQAVREFQRLHLGAAGCPNLPHEERVKLSKLETSASLPSVLRRYYIIAAKAIGLYDTTEGMRCGGGSIPLGSSVALQGAGELSPLKDDLRKQHDATGENDEGQTEVAKGEAGDITPLKLDGQVSADGCTPAGDGTEAVDTKHPLESIQVPNTPLNPEEDFADVRNRKRKEREEEERDLCQHPHRHGHGHRFGKEHKRKQEEEEEDISKRAII